MIYLDNAATTKVFDESIEIASKYMRDVYGNAGSLHAMGHEAEKALDVARKLIALKLNSAVSEIFFTSGATESNNLVFNAIRNNKARKNKIIISSIEHAAVYKPALFLEKEGFELVIVDVDENGKLDIDKLIENVDEKTALVSIIMVNNELAVVQDIAEISRRLKAINYDGLFHTDATQAVCKLALDVKKLGVDFLSASAHKFHGPKGVGFLYIREKTAFLPMFYGGKQENSYRAGTENVPLITAMAKSFAMCQKNLQESYDRVSSLRDKVYQHALNHADMMPTIDVSLGASPYIISIAYKNVKSEVLLHAFEQKQIAVSSGSACSSKSKKISRILKAINFGDDYNEGVIRVSFSRFTTDSDVDAFLKASDEIIESIKRTK